MKTIEELLKNLSRPEVLEFGLVTNRLPSVNIGGKFEPVDDEAPSNERLMAMLVTMGGGRHVDNLSDKPVQWTTKLEGVGVIAVAAILRKDIVQARFTVAKRDAGASLPASSTRLPAAAPTNATQAMKPAPPPAPTPGGAAKSTQPQSARSIPSAPTATPAAPAAKPAPAAPAARPAPPTSTPMTAAKATQQIQPQTIKGIGGSPGTSGAASSVRTPAAAPASATVQAAAPVPPPLSARTVDEAGKPPLPVPPPPDDEWDDDDEPTLQTLSPPVAPPHMLPPDMVKAKPARRPEEVAAEEKAAAEKAAAEKAATEKAAADKAAAEKAAADKAAADKAAAEKAAAERAAAERAAADKAAADKAAADKAAADKAAADKAAADKAAADKAAADKAAADKAAADKAAADKAAADKAAADKAAADKAAAEKAAADKAAADKATAEKAAAEKAARDRAEQERATRERAEQERMIRERAEREAAEREAAAAAEAAEQERLDREAAEQEAAEREAAEAAEREAAEAAEREAAEKAAAEAAEARAAEERATQERVARDRAAAQEAARARASQPGGRRISTPTSLDAVDVEITTSHPGSKAARRIDVHQDADGTEDTISLPGGVDVATAAQNEAARARARGRLPTTTQPMIPEKDRPRVDGAAAIDSFLAMAVGARATDLIVTAGRPVMLRIATDLMPRTQPVPAEQVERIAKDIVPARLRETLEKEGSCDFAVEHLTHGRFRVNVSRSRGGVKLTLRVIAKELPTLSSLGLPEGIANGIRHQSGLVLLTGPAGQGKSSTLAALVDLLNRETGKHVATIEEPIEHVHARKKGLVSQRDVGLHTRTKAKAWSSALRSDPDVVVVSELRDAESMRLALSAAEGGRLVLGTMNAPSTVSAIERVLRLFTSADQHWARTSLASTLRLVVGQHLVPSADRTRVHAAAELLPWSVPLWNAIRSGRTFDIPAAQGKTRGVVRLDESLAELVRAQKVTIEVAKQYAEAPAELEALVNKRRG